YLQLLDWTGRQIRRDDVGSIPEEFAPILERLECSADLWLDYIRSFRKLFRNEAGLAANCRAFRGQRRLNRARAISS
ncbi:MAG: transposase, partial [Planctomycetia bacterium]